MPPVSNGYGRYGLTKTDRVTHRRLHQVSRILRSELLSGATRRRNRTINDTLQDISSSNESEDDDELTPPTSSAVNIDKGAGGMSGLSSSSNSDSSFGGGTTNTTGASLLSSAEARRLFSDLQRHHQWRQHRQVLADALRLASRRKLLRRRVVPPPTPTGSDSVSTASSTASTSWTGSRRSITSTTSSRTSIGGDSNVTTVLNSFVTISDNTAAVAAAAAAAAASAADAGNATTASSSHNPRLMPKRLKDARDATTTTKSLAAQPGSSRSTSSATVHSQKRDPTEYDSPSRRSTVGKRKPPRERAAATSGQQQPRPQQRQQLERALPQQWRPCPRKARMAQRELEMDEGYFSLTVCLSQENEQEEDDSSVDSESLEKPEGHQMLKRNSLDVGESRPINDDNDVEDEDKSTITMPGVELSLDHSSKDQELAVVLAVPEAVVAETTAAQQVDETPAVDDAVEITDAQMAAAAAELLQHEQQQLQPQLSKQQQHQHHQKHQKRQPVPRKSLEPGLIGGLHQQLASSWDEALAASRARDEDGSSSTKTIAATMEELEIDYKREEIREEATPEEQKSKEQHGMQEIEKLSRGSHDSADNRQISYDSDEDAAKMMQQQLADTADAAEALATITPRTTAKISAAMIAEMARMSLMPAMRTLPLTSCPAKIVGHLDQYKEQLELSRHLLAHWVPHKRSSRRHQQAPPPTSIKKAQLRASLNLAKQLRFSEGSRRRCSATIQQVPLEEQLRQTGGGGISSAAAAAAATTPNEAVQISASSLSAPMLTVPTSPQSPQTQPSEETTVEAIGRGERHEG